MKAADYPRAQPPVPQKYAQDETWGMVIVIVSALRLLSRLPVAFAASMVGPNGLVDHRYGTVLICALLAVRLVGGIGVRSSRRWGIMLVAATSTIYLLLEAFGLATRFQPLGLVSLAVSAYIVFYCGMRLAGRYGPKPV